MDAPKPTGRTTEALTLTGCLIPWKDGQPVLLGMPGSDASYLPLFTTEDKLRATLGRAGVTFGSVKQVDAGPEFLASIPHDVTIIHDPWYTPEGRVRFQQVMREQADAD